MPNAGVRERAANRVAIGLMIGCVALLVVTLGALGLPAVRAWLGLKPILAPTYASGVKIDVPQEFYSSSSRTLVLFARSSCPACRQTAPLFTRLVTEALTAHQGALLVAGLSSDQDEEVAFARSIGLDDSRMKRIDLEKLRVRRMPTIVVVDAAGTVRYANEGAITPDQFDQYFQAIRAVLNER